MSKGFPAPFATTIAIELEVVCLSNPPIYVCLIIIRIKVTPNFLLAALD